MEDVTLAFFRGVEINWTGLSEQPCGRLRPLKSSSLLRLILKWTESDDWVLDDDPGLTDATEVLVASVFWWLDEFLWYLWE